MLIFPLSGVVLSLLYLGPGLGVGAILLVVLVLVLIVAALAVVLWTPIKRFFRKWSRQDRDQS